MVEVLRSTQVPLLSFVLLLACVAKLTIHDPRSGIAPGALVAIGRRPVVVMVALIEGALGVALLLNAHASVRLATTVVFATATWVVGELRMTRPDAGCGCFGGLSSTPVRLSTLVRASLFTVAAISTLGVRQSGLDVMLRPTVSYAVILVVELGLFAILSPEIGVALARISRRVPCELRTVPLEETYEALRVSKAWREYAGVVTSAEPTDVWRELCWRYLVLPGKIDGRPVDIVFAVPLEGRRPEVKVAVVAVSDESEPDDEDTGPRPVRATPV